jgi:hypothetical protein
MVRCRFRRCHSERRSNDSPRGASNPYEDTVPAVAIGKNAAEDHDWSNDWSKVDAHVCDVVTRWNLTWITANCAVQR